MKKGSSGNPVAANPVVSSSEHASVRMSDPVAMAPAAQMRLEAPHENVVQMERENGVNFVWIELNGIPLRFIFDTGASSIFISPAEALVLVKQGTLSEEDLIGEEHYQDATGDVSIGTVINLKEVQIGNRTLRNVKASVSDNFESPLLLGQSALEQFGTIEIDNRNSRIILR